MNRFEFYSNLRNFKENTLQHYGIPGQKWGERRWQNQDGTFNEAGKERYFGSSGKKAKSKKNEYQENKKYAKIVNDEKVKNALQEYVNVLQDVNKESERIMSDDFRKNNKKAQNFDGDGTEYWYEFADKDIVKKNDESHWKLREAISKNSYDDEKNKWDYETFNKVYKDIIDIINDNADSPDKIYDLLKEKTGVDFGNANDNYEELLNKNIDNNKKIYSNNIKNLKECYDEYGYDENGYKKVDTETAGKVDFHNSQNNYIDKEAEHEITEAPSTKNKLRNVNKNDIKKELNKGEKAIKNFDKNYNKALNEVAQMYYDAYKDNVKNPMSFEKFKKSIGIDTNKNNKKTVDIGYRSYDNNLVYTTFIKANIPDGPTAWLIFDQNGDVVSSASFDPKYRKVFVEKY